MVAFDTGGDGGYAFRATDGSLTDREKKWLANSWEFRLVVRHRRVYVDGGYALPSDDYFDESDDHPEQWVELPNGNYKVTVNAIEWYSEPGGVDSKGRPTDKSLASYVIQFRVVDDLSSVRSSRTPPRLETSKDYPVSESTSFADYDVFGGTKDEVDSEYVVVVNERFAPIPGFHVSVESTQSFYDAIYGSVGNQMLPDRIEELVIATSDQTPCLGVVARASGASRRGDEPWTISFHAKQIVTVTELLDQKPWRKAKVMAFAQPKSQVSEGILEKLKGAFTEYAKRSTAYRDNIEYPDFEVERAQSMTSPTGLTHLLIHHLQIPMSDKLDLLRQADESRVQEMLKIMSTSE